MNFSSDFDKNVAKMADCEVGSTSSEEKAATFDEAFLLENPKHPLLERHHPSERKSASETSSFIPVRKSVICSVKDVVGVKFMGDTSEAEESSEGSLLVFEETSDLEVESSKQSDYPTDCQPSVDPSEIECVVTDTSGDESSETEASGSCDEKSTVRQDKQLLCTLCKYIVLDGKGPKELSKHLQSSHKFAVREACSIGAEDKKSSTTNHDSKELTARKKGYICTKNRGGCGSVFFSKQGLQSHHARSKSAGGLCWMATSAEDKARLLLSCPSCSFECTSKRGMVQHFNTSSDCLRDPDKAVAALALDCRVCGENFWTVEERSNHEVSEHPERAAHLMLKCYVCSDCFSSKVCLKKHMRVYHSKKEQFVGNVGFRCRLCYLTFPSLKLVQEHFQEFHPSVLVFRCQKCSLILKTKKTFLVHLKSTKCGSVRQECTVCQKVLWSKRALSIHYRMKHFSSNHTGFLCRICKKRFDSKSERKQHYLADHQGDSPFICPICNKGFASKSGMYGHRQTHVKTGLSKCEFCGKEFNRRDSYNEHLLIHTGPRHKCPHCGKEFVQRSNLVRHIRIHTGEKPYKCSYCEKTFSDKGACNSHIRVHTREEACGCPYCGQVFSKKQKLKYHIRKHTGEGLVRCEYCGKSFTNSHSLKEHRMIHDHRTQILCSQCGKSFSTAKYLQRHVAMVHEAALVYTCPLCSRSFSQQGRLKTHLMTHTGIKHLRCLLCTKAYSSRKSLRHHLLNVHSVTTEHPDYKHCFYAMTPEETGLKISKGHSLSKQPILKPKSELLSADSDSDDRESSSDEGDGSDDASNVQHVPMNSSLLRSTSFPPIRTKAARKQLPFNVLEKRVEIPSKSPDPSHIPNDDKMRKLTKHQPNTVAGSVRVQSEKLCSLTSVSNCKDFHNDSSSESTSSDSLKMDTVSYCKNRRKPVEPNNQLTIFGDVHDYKRGKKSGTKIVTVSKISQTVSDSSNQSSVVKSGSETSKSNRRARYKLQTPKKRTIPTEEDNFSD